LQILTSLGLEAHGLHALMQQRARLKALDRFRASDNAVLTGSLNPQTRNKSIIYTRSWYKLKTLWYTTGFNPRFFAPPQVLVCSDVAARGLDLEGVAHVVHFDVPQAHPPCIF